MSRKKKIRRIVPNPFSSRNRGAVWGRNSAFFVLSVFFVIGNFAVAALVSILKAAGQSVSRIWRYCHQRGEINPDLRQCSLDAQLSGGFAKQEFAPLMEKPKVSFDDVIGLEPAKGLIRSRMIWPFKFPLQAGAYNIKRGGGLLLLGPKGTGKTTLAKAVATEIDAPFFHIKPSRLVRGNVGKSEQLVEDLFIALREHPKAILFFDEVEELTQSRDASRSTIMKRLITQLLQEWDGLDSQKENHALLVIGATNLPWQVDSAFIRTGRFDFLVYVGLPDFASRRRLLQLVLAGRLVSPEVPIDLLAEKTEGYSGADIRGLVEEAAAIAFTGSISQTSSQDLPPICLDDFLESLKKVKPSVTQDELKRYEKFRRAHQLL